MHSMTSTVRTHSDCYLQIRRAKQTIFTDVIETTSILELKQIIGNILRIDSNQILVSRNGEILDIDSKNLVDYGITTRDARPQDPYQLEFALKSDDNSCEKVNVIPYSAQTDFLDEE